MSSPPPTSAKTSCSRKPRSSVRSAAGAKIPEGEPVGSGPALKGGAGELMNEGITSQWVDQDAMGRDEDVGEAVFTGDDTGREGRGFTLRLEPWRWRPIGCRRPRCSRRFSWLPAG